MRKFVCILVVLCLLAPAFAIAEGISPTTGLPFEGPYRPVLVEISNSPQARPIHGIAEADVVYELVYWGPAHTRYLMLFSDVHPEEAGSVRSSRLFMHELRQMWDCPFVFFGGEYTAGNSIYDFMKEQGVPQEMRFDGTRGTMGPVLYRKEGLMSPHDAMTNVRIVAEDNWPENEDGTPFAPRLPEMTFSDSPSRGEDSAVMVDVSYHEDYAPSYVYQPQTRLYERWYCGEPQRDASGAPVFAANVIVQYARLDYFENERSKPIIPTTGSGPADFFIDGTHIRGTWYRDDVNSWMQYRDASGQEIILYPGKTFVQVMPLEMPIAFTDAKGTTHTVDAGRE